MHKTCTVEGCTTRTFNGNTMCAAHRNRTVKYGSPTGSRYRGPQECSQDGCTKTAKARGLCGTHYYHWLRAHHDNDPERPRCSVEGCSRAVANRRGWCSVHYQRWSKYGDPTLTKRHRNAPGATCSHEECTERPQSRGMCRPHYHLWEAAHQNARTRTPQEIAQYIAERSAPTDDGCVVWTGNVTVSGYGRTTIGGVAYRIHRLAYELHHRVQLTRAETVHHVCANRLCINPDHLQVITPAENVAEMMERAYYKRRIAELEAQLAAAQVRTEATP